MIQRLLTSAGESLVRTGDSLLEEANAYRVEYSNPREVPERNIYDATGERLQNFGQKLLSLANPKS